MKVSADSENQFDVSVPIVPDLKSIKSGLTFAVRERYKPKLKFGKWSSATHL